VNIKRNIVNCFF